MTSQNSKRSDRLIGLLGLDGSKVIESEFRNDNTFIIDIISKQQPHLLGNNSEESYIELTQWLSISDKIKVSDLKFINNYLSLRSYFVGQSLSIADLVMFDAIQSFDIIDVYSNIIRWRQHASLFMFPSQLKDTFTTARSPTLIPAHLFETEPLAEGETAASVPAFPKPALIDIVPASTAKSEKVINATTAVCKKEKKVDKVLDAPKEPSAGTGESEAAVGDALDPSKLDIRVGLVLRCWNHPDSEKLLCEEIDVGEGEGAARSIASGLRAHYAPADLEGKKVMVLANLKERPMAGFKSQGMVLCASNADHTVVKLVVPPENSKPGDRVTFPGYNGEPAPANQVAKKKIFEKLAPQLHTDSNGIACWNSIPFTIGSEVCSSLMPNATVA